MATRQTKRSSVNFAVDAVITVGFLLVAVSGVVLLAAGSGGYQGGRNPHAVREVLSLSRWTWRAIHDWGAAALGGGVLLHIALHWKWITCMTRNLFKRREEDGPKSVQPRAQQCTTAEV